MLNDLTAEFLRSVLDYNPETGVFTWKVDRRGRGAKKGQVAGYLSPNGTKSIWVNNKLYVASRLAWLHYYGVWPNKSILHLDSNRNNTAITNLREAGTIKNLTAKYLQSALDYNPETGIFTWKTNKGCLKRGHVAGYVDSGYRQITLAGKKYKAHRLAWLYYYGEWPKGLIDHKDQDTMNNAISNLRECTPGENQQNSTRSRGSTSNYQGVSWYTAGKKWRARITIKGETLLLGDFDDELEAANVYREAKEKYHPFFWEGAK